MLTAPSQSQPIAPQPAPSPVQATPALPVCPTCGRAPQPAPYSDPDEINLLEYIYVLVKNKHWIIGATVFGLIFGYVAALIKGPTYVAEAVIAAKESEGAKTPNLSGFGALGGLVASQLNMSANPGLDKIELILDSRKFNAEMIEKYDLLPMVYEQAWPKQYRKFFDNAAGQWNAKFVRPNLLSIGGFLEAKYLNKTTNKNNTMTLKVESSDSTFSDTLMARYLEHLNTYIQTNVQSDAKENVGYLETQLITIADPLLREKIQGLIANEVEKQMLVSKEAFRVVDPVFRYTAFKQKRLFPVVFGFGLFFLTTMLAVFAHALRSSRRTNEDERLIASIKSEIAKI